MWRIVRPSGSLVLGTPGYGRWLCRVLKRIYGKALPGVYVHEHITRYTRDELAGRLRAAGYEILDCQYVRFCEMIVKARKPLTSGPRRA